MEQQRRLGRRLVSAVSLTVTMVLVGGVGAAGAIVIDASSIDRAPATPLANDSGGIWIIEID